MFESRWPEYNGTVLVGRPACFDGDAAKLLARPNPIEEAPFLVSVTGYESDCLWFFAVHTKANEVGVQVGPAVFEAQGRIAEVGELRRPQLQLAVTIHGRIAGTGTRADVVAVANVLIQSTVEDSPVAVRKVA